MYARVRLTTCSLHAGIHCIHVQLYFGKLQCTCTCYDRKSTCTCMCVHVHVHVHVQCTCIHVHVHVCLKCSHCTVYMAWCDKVLSVCVWYSNRAECFLQTNQPRKAIKDCNRALAMNPFNMKVRYTHTMTCTCTM